jgi:hypothetical protein
VVFLFFLPRNKGVVYNVLLWAFLLIGVGLQSCFYFMEAYARKSCPANVRLRKRCILIMNDLFICRTQYGIKLSQDRLFAVFHYQHQIFCILIYELIFLIFIYPRYSCFCGINKNLSKKRNDLFGKFLDTFSYSFPHHH